MKQPDWFDPELNPKMRSFGEHYGIAIVPTRPATPRHKGKAGRIATDQEWQRSQLDHLSLAGAEGNDQARDKTVIGHGGPPDQSDCATTSNIVNALLDPALSRLTTSRNSRASAASPGLAAC